MFLRSSSSSSSSRLLFRQAIVTTRRRQHHHGRHKKIITGNNNNNNHHRNNHPIVQSTIIQLRAAHTSSLNTTNTTITNTATSSFSSSSSFPSIDKLATLTTLLGLASLLLESHLRTDLSDAQSARDASYPPTRRLIAEHHVRTLEREGVVIIENALSGEDLRGARLDIGRLLFAGAKGTSGCDCGDCGDSVDDLNNGGGTIDGGKEEGGGGSGGFGEHAGVGGETSEDGEAHEGGSVRQDLVSWLRPQTTNTNTNTNKQHDEENDTNDNNSNNIQNIKNNNNNNNHKQSQPTIGPHLHHCIHLIRGVASTLSTHQYTDSHSHIVPLQCQLSMYKGDGTSGYSRHLDRCDATLGELGLLEYMRLSDYRGRVVTVILYLNEEGRGVEDGGGLRCWLRRRKEGDCGGGGGDGGGDGGENDDVKDNSSDKNDIDDNANSDKANSDNNHRFDPPFDIQPTGGSMIIFHSNRMEHEVLVSFKDRYALTVWINGDLTEDCGV